MPQSPIVPEGITVADLVARGRFPYRQPLKGMSKEDYQIVSEAMDMMGISDLADRCVDELSGGQRQRVWLALALAQDTDILLLDEPTTFLDISYQIEILDLLTELNQKKVQPSPWYYMILIYLLATQIIYLRYLMENY